MTVLSVTVRAQNGRNLGGMFEAPLAGGARAALAALDDRVSADRSQFLLELIRRWHSAPRTSQGESNPGALRSLLAQFDTAQTQATDAPRETVPLPLSPETWINVVFGGRATPDTLLGAILKSRSASLLYCGLLSLDDSTREWLVTRPDLIAFLASPRSAAFLVAAPALRVRDGRMQLPGGEPADAVWEALVGRRGNEPAEFIREAVTRREGRVAYFLSAISQLTPTQIRVALNLDSPDAASRVAAARRLYAVFDRIAPTWKIDQQAFFRPTFDPALLLSDLRVDERGTPILPGSRGFWSAVFAEPSLDDANQPADGSFSEVRTADPVDFAWLCERVFAGSYFESRRRYNVVLFASRNIERIAPQAERDALEAVRASGQYPALTAVLERARLADLAAFAAAARRAARLSAIADHAAAERALAQFQGALAFITRAAIRGALAPDSLSHLVSSLSAVDVNERGDYDGRLVRWVATYLAVPSTTASDHGSEAGTADGIDGDTADPIEGDLRRMLAGSTSVDPRIVEWEGTRYRVDLPAAEATRLLRVLGDEPRPYISAARALVVMADAFGSGYALHLAADTLLARGLLDLAYAAAFGQPDATPISAREAASRHDFGLRSPNGGDARAAWRLPEAGHDKAGQWHMMGSLLGLDVRLAQFSLTRTSSRPPARRPSLDDIDRRVFTEAVSLMAPTSLNDGDRDAIVAALNAGRARLAAIHTPSDALAVADELRLSPARRTLLAWAVVHEPERVSVSLSLTELLWLGLGPMPLGANLHAWGAPGEPRLGCLCLRLIDRRPWETLAGRWNTGIFASGFSDLNLRLAELLAELRMPAVLLGAVLRSATVDFIENANSRDQDDRRGPLEFVQTLSRERVEEYLALLTTDGPLVPVADAGNPTSHPRSLR